MVTAEGVWMAEGVPLVQRIGKAAPANMRADELLLPTRQWREGRMPVAAGSWRAAAEAAGSWGAGAGEAAWEAAAEGPGRLSR